MKNLAIMISILASAPVLAQSGSCKPDYDIVRDECVSTKEVVGHTSKTQSVRVNEGACEVRDPATVYCEEATQGKKDLAARLGVDISALVIVDAYTREANGACGSLTNLRRKSDVHCVFKADVPKYKMVAGEKCAIMKAVDKNNCFSNPKSVDASALQGCLDNNDNSAEALWSKSQCLLDIRKNAMQLPISTEQYRDAVKQLAILKDQVPSSGPTQVLSAYLKAEVK